jgi:hypothetical protein
MTPTSPFQHPSQIDTINTVGARRRQLRVMQLLFAGTAALAMLALFDAARPDTTGPVLNSASVHLVDLAVPAPASGPSGLQLPQTPPNLAGGGFAADTNDDNQAQLQQQIAQQEMQQSEQEAEQQNEAAQLQAQQDEQQGLQVEEQAGQ